MDTKIYLLRHGETVWNTEKRFQGGLNSPLTEKGVRQAQSAGAKLAALLGSASSYQIISSPLGRCIQTAEIIVNQLDKDSDEIRIEPRLREHSYGEWEGMTEREIILHDGERFRARKQDRWRVPAPGGENYFMVSERVSEWLSEIRCGESLIVISHGCTGRIMRGIYSELPRDQFMGLAENHDHVYLLSGKRVSLI